jgi:hypothetical protein
MRYFYGKPTTCLRCGKVHKGVANHTEKKVNKHAAAYQKLVHGYLVKVAKSVAKQLAGKLTKADDLDELQELLDDLDLDGMVELAGGLTTALRELFRAAESEGLVLAGLEETRGMTRQLDRRALSWAKERAAELVGRKILEDGSVIDNPNPIYSILETTRDLLRATVAEAVESGWGTKELTDAIEGSYAFSEARAEMIARTELAAAMTQGNVEAWRNSGQVTHKRSLLGQNENHGDDDIANAEEGWIEFEEEFQSGHFAPPYHPNCCCALQPRVGEDEEEPDEEMDEDLEAAAKTSLRKLASPKVSLRKIKRSKIN